MLGQPVEEFLLIVSSVAQVSGNSNRQLWEDTRSTIIRLIQSRKSTDIHKAVRELTKVARTVRRMNILIEDSS